MKQFSAIIFFWTAAIAWPQSFTFQPGVLYPVQKAAVATVNGDFDHDGKLDLAVANAGSSTVSIFLGQGDGTFNAPTTVTIPGGCVDDMLIVGDFNNDGNTDLLAVCALQPTLWFLPGLGTGKFGAPVSTTLPQLLVEGWIEGNFNNVVAGDFNGDGALDLVLVTGVFGSNVTLELDLLPGKGDGNFGTPTPIVQNYVGGVVVAADFDRDGNLDLAIDMEADTLTSSVAILRGNGKGLFQTIATYQTPGSILLGSMTVADVNRDGKPDLIVAGSVLSDGSTSESTALTVFIGNGDCTFKIGFSANENSGGTGAMALADFFGTGTPDLVEEHVQPGQTGLPIGHITMTIRASNGDGTFQAPLPLSVPTGLAPWWFNLAVGDWNGDGLMDLAFTATSSSAELVAPDTGSITQDLAAAYQAMPPANLLVLLNTLPHAPFANGGQALGASGGSGSLNLTFPAGFAWTATSTASWIVLSGSASGSGSGTLQYQVVANAGADRSGTIDVGGYIFTVQQQAASISGLNLIGSMPHIAAEENWTSIFTLVNNAGSSNQVRLSLFGSNLDASGSGNPLQLPLNLPQQSSLGVLVGASLDNTLSPNATWIASTAGKGMIPVQTGSAQVSATGALGGFAIFHRFSDAQEAVVPLTLATPNVPALAAAAPNAPSYLLAFDNTNGIVTSVAVANVSSQPANIGYVIRDDTGAQIGSGTLATLPGNGQIAFVLPDATTGFPVTINQRGTVEFDTPQGGQISVLGIRNTPQVTLQGTITTLTTVPALSSVGSGGGSFAFIAAGGDGWQTTFVLVNTGGSTSATLKFFDPNGNPLALPISFPQTGVVNQASSINPTLAAGATLLVETSGAATLLTGSAQLTTTGNVSGFVIFRHNGQEAVVPIESRNANGYLLAFDNTAGTATGLAVNAVSSTSQALNIPVVIRDDSGNQLATDNLPLAANGDFAGNLGQKSPTLGRILFPATANIRGTVEFDAPAGVHIGIIGIRTPPTSTPTYTSLPALAK